MDIKIYRTKENEKEIQDILNLTMDFESAKWDTTKVIIGLHFVQFTYKAYDYTT